MGWSDTRSAPVRPGPHPNSRPRQGLAVIGRRCHRDHAAPQCRSPPGPATPPRIWTGRWRIPFPCLARRAKAEPASRAHDCVAIAPFGTADTSLCAFRRGHVSPLEGTSWAHPCPVRHSQPSVAMGKDAGRPACFADGSADDRGAPKGIRNLTSGFRRGSSRPAECRIVAGHETCPEYSLPRRVSARFSLFQGASSAQGTRMAHIGSVSLRETRGASVPRRVQATAATRRSGLSSYRA